MSVYCIFQDTSKNDIKSFLNVKNVLHFIFDLLRIDMVTLLRTHTYTHPPMTTKEYFMPAWSLVIIE